MRSSLVSFLSLLCSRPGSEIQGVEIPGADNNTQNVNNHPTEIPGVDNEGVDNDNDEKRRYIVPNDRHGDGLIRDYVAPVFIIIIIRS